MVPAERLGQACGKIKETDSFSHPLLVEICSSDPAAAVFVLENFDEAKLVDDNRCKKAERKGTDEELDLELQCLSVIPGQGKQTRSQHGEYYKQDYAGKKIGVLSSARHSMKFDQSDPREECFYSGTAEGPACVAGVAHILMPSPSATELSSRLIALLAVLRTGLREKARLRSSAACWRLTELTAVLLGRGKRAMISEGFSPSVLT